MRAFRSVTIKAMLATCAVCLPQTPASTTNDLAQRVFRYVDPLVRMRDFEGDILVARNGRILMARRYELLRGGTRSRPADDGVYGIGSLTKIFTAAAIVHLAEVGSINLEEPARAYLPEFRVSDSITVRRLLEHTSGLQDYFRWPEFSRRWQESIGDSAFLATVNEKPLDFPPGSRSDYSNTGYRVLAMITERVTRKPYAEYLADWLAPARLRGTGDLTSGAPARLRTGMNPGPPPTRLAPGFAVAPEWAKGSGSMYSTTGDLLRAVSWMSRAGHRPESGRPSAFGWGPRNRFGRGMMEQNGRVPNGYSSYIGVYPREDLVVIVLSDIQCDVAERIGIDVAGLAFDSVVPVPPMRPAPRGAPSDRVRERQLEGMYDIAPGFSLSVRATAAGLELAGPDSMFVALDHEGGDRYFFRPLYVPISFERDSRGTVTALNWNGSFRAARR